LLLNNVLHRDLKPENIFIHNNIFKIGDFGLSTKILFENEQYTSLVGTPKYFSPQIHLSQKYTIKTDI